MRARTVGRNRYGPWSGILFGPIRGPDFGPALDPDIFWPVVPVLIFNYLHVPDQRKKRPERSVPYGPEIRTTVVQPRTEPVSSLGQLQIQTKICTTDRT